MWWVRATLSSVALLACTYSANADTTSSTCYGTTSNGRLENGVRLPADGNNFTAYGSIPRLAGRTYVHSLVSRIVVDAYQSLEQSMPDKVFKYAETGYEDGGLFKPHKTHQNGLSIDFLVPVVNAQGESVHLPSNPFNRYGYDIEFDAQGRYEEYHIDFETLAAHVTTLHKSAMAHGVELWRVLFDPRLQDKLYATSQGDYLLEHVMIPAKKSWVRHDEHIHVDFRIPCRPL